MRDEAVKKRVTKFIDGGKTYCTRIPEMMKQQDQEWNVNARALLAYATIMIGQ